MSGRKNVVPGEPRTVEPDQTDENHRHLRVFSPDVPATYYATFEDNGSTSGIYMEYGLQFSVTSERPQGTRDSYSTQQNWSSSQEFWYEQSHKSGDEAEASDIFIEEAPRKNTFYEDLKAGLVTIDPEDGDTPFSDDLFVFREHFSDDQRFQADVYGVDEYGNEFAIEIKTKKD